MHLAAGWWHTPGKTSLTCQYKGPEYQIDFEIIQKEAPAILGGETSAKLKIVKRLYSLGKKTEEVPKEYKHLFTGLGCLPGEHTIKQDPEVKPDDTYT